MNGWRGRIGLLVPSVNFTVEMEFFRALPEGVSVHTARVKYRSFEREEEKVQAYIDMGKNVPKAAKEVADIKPKVIVWACTSGSFVKGVDYDQELIREIEKETGIRATTTSTAVVNALKELNVKKIAVATPYIREIIEKEKIFLEHSISGLKVLEIQGLGIVQGYDTGTLEPKSAYIAARDVDSSEVECVFISCTAWRTFEIIEALESDLKKPVITSNQATLWASLKVLGIQGIKGYGQLLELH
jgi:maleate isomerase